MKNISTILGIICLLLIGVLFYLHFTHVEELKKVSNKADQNSHTSFKIAYFDIDSLQAHYESYQNALNEMKKKEAYANTQLQNLKAKNQKRFGEIQQKGPSMSQAEGEAANRELGFMEQNYRQVESDLMKNLQNEQIEMINNLRKEIEDYLAIYNKENRYAYIFSYQPGFIIYYKDSVYDITANLVEGLNAQLKNKKK
jgi:outer membrane protein